MTEIQPIDLNKKTVFVLGAGASHPYGFPLGMELVSKINLHFVGTNCSTALTKNGFELSMINKFSEALSRTDIPTIDSFLEKKRKFRSLGAHTIAFTLLPFENENTLFQIKDWYTHLYNAINFENAKPDIGKITFVSFNYDRSLEHFFNKAIEYNCADDLTQCAVHKCENLEIIHAHGSFGEYPQTPYGINPEIDNETFHKAAESIKIPSDQLEDSHEFTNAKTAISQADNIIFIGFGYDPTTLKRLTENIDCAKKRILGTAFQIHSVKRNNITNFFKNKIELASDDMTADSFLHAYLPL
jgi:hypothetical protein